MRGIFDEIEGLENTIEMLRAKNKRLRERIVKAYAKGRADAAREHAEAAANAVADDAHTLDSDFIAGAARAACLAVGKEDAKDLSLRERLDRAHAEILAVCEKYDVSLCPKYDEGVAVEIVAETYDAAAPEGHYKTLSMEI